MITSRLPAIAFATTRRGTEAHPLFQHTAVLCQQHSEGSQNPEPNKPQLTRAIYTRLYGPIQEEVSKIAGLLRDNPDAARRRLEQLHRDLLNHTLL